MLLPTHEFLGLQEQFLGSTGFSTGIAEFNLFGSTVPSNIAVGDASPYTLGTRIRVDSDCTLARLRFYRAAQDTTTVSRTLQIWSTAGVLLTTATTTEIVSTAGWVEAVPALLLPLTSGTEYIVSYNKPLNEAYPAVNNFFATDYVSGFMVAPANVPVTKHNGLYFDAVDTFPVANFAATSYFADMVVTL